MRAVLLMAIVANSLDLIATAFGIHFFGNREGNPFMADLMQNHWWLFVGYKGLLTPLLIYRLHRYRNSSPVLATFGMCLVTLALTIAVGQWIGWLAGVVRVQRASSL